MAWQVQKARSGMLLHLVAPVVPAVVHKACVAVQRIQLVLRQGQGRRAREQSRAGVELSPAAPCSCSRLHPPLPAPTGSSPTRLLLLTQLPAEQALDVAAQVRLAAGLGNHRHTALHVPAQRHLQPGLPTAQRLRLQSDRVNCCCPAARLPPPVSLASAGVLPAACATSITAGLSSTPPLPWPSGP